MTEGISKERLIAIKQSLPYGQARLNLERLITTECKELNPWLPIDENTPKGVDLLLLVDHSHLRKRIGRFYGSYCIDQLGNGITATHYQELLEAPRD